MWSWILEGIGLTGAFLVGRRYWWSWTLLLLNTILWGYYGYTSRQYGFVFASFLYAPVYAKNLVSWYRKRNRPFEERTLSFEERTLDI